MKASATNVTTEIPEILLIMPTGESPTKCIINNANPINTTTPRRENPNVREAYHENTS